MIAAFLGLLLNAGIPSALSADSSQDHRVETGLKVLRALLAADLDLEKKVVDDKKLLILFFYTDDHKRADELARSFGKGEGSASAEPIHGLASSAEATGDSSFAAYGHRVPAGIFLTQPPSAEALRAVIRFGIANHVIVYSPFEGHVEGGVLGGLAIEAQVRPYINQSTLTASQISLKEFFMRIAKVYR